MRGSSVATWVGLACAAMAVDPARGAPCAGFVDIEDTSPFCSSVTWLKNREITSGCTATQYCPSEPVSRLAMAAFMSRLQRMLPPHVVDVQGRPLGPVDRYTGTYANVIYRNAAGTPFTLTVINAPANAAPPSYSFRHTYLFYEFANCDPAGRIYANDVPVDPILANLGLVLRWTGGARLLHAPASFPPVSVSAPVLSYGYNGTCTNFAQTFQGYEVTRVEDLAARFAEPLTVR